MCHKKVLRLAYSHRLPFATKIAEARVKAEARAKAQREARAKAEAEAEVRAKAEESFSTLSLGQSKPKQNKGRKMWCPNGHTLQQLMTKDNLRSCDSCGACNLPKGTVVQRCIPCNFDLCQRCSSPSQCVQQILCVNPSCRTVLDVSDIRTPTVKCGMCNLVMTMPGEQMDTRQCLQVARSFVDGLGINSAYFDERYDRCYCSRCYPDEWSDTISNEGPTPYVIPRGWMRFGLALPARARDLDVFNQWSTSFHGVKSVPVLKSILQCGQLMKPGDKLLDGTQLKSTKCAGRQDNVFYSSPTIKYAGLKFYAEPQPFGNCMAASIVLQCRQRPGSFTTQGETMEFSRNWPGHLARTCPHVDLNAIEWKSDNNIASIPYGILVRIYPAKEAGDEYCSPVDFAA